MQTRESPRRATRISGVRRWRSSCFSTSARGLQDRYPVETRGPISSSATFPQYVISSESAIGAPGLTESTLP